MSREEVICLKHFVPSANSSSCEVMTDVNEIRKRRGPRMLLCGTPEITGRELDRLLPTKRH